MRMTHYDPFKGVTSSACNKAFTTRRASDKGRKIGHGWAVEIAEHGVLTAGAAIYKVRTMCLLGESLWWQASCHPSLLLSVSDSPCPVGESKELLRASFVSCLMDGKGQLNVYCTKAQLISCPFPSHDRLLKLIMKAIGSDWSLVWEEYKRVVV